MVHAGRQVIVLLDRHRLLRLHRVRLCDLLVAGLPAHEEMVHLLLFFSSALHRLQVPVEQGRTAGSGGTGEGDGLHLAWRDEVHLLDLSLEVHRQIVLLLALSEGVGNDEILLLRDSAPGDAFGFAIEARFDGVLDEWGRLEAVHLK